MQQRGIRREALEALLEHGCARHICRDGREIVFFDKAARGRLVKSDPRVAKAKSLAKAYAIVGANGVVVTVGHRYRRVKR